MNIKKFFLSYYKNATTDFYIGKLNEPIDGKHLHSHEYYQLCYVLKGSLGHHIDDKKASLLYGDVFILPPNVPHYIEKENDATLFYTISFMPNFFTNSLSQPLLFTDFLKTVNNLSRENIPLKISLTASDRIFVEIIFDRILAEFNNKNVGAEEVIHECLAMLLTILSRNYYDKHLGEFSIFYESNEQSVMHCIKYLSSNFEQDISLDKICKLATMSKSHFCKLFTQITKVTFNDFLNAKRIEKATELLLTSNLKVQSVASLVGYKDFSTFSRNFKKRIGASPEKYRIINKI